MTLTPVDCTLCENTFGRYCIPRSSQHRPAPQQILRGKVWELDTINFMRKHAGHRDIIHAGMFFGDFLPGLSSAMASTNTIYGFEPNPENFACAQWTVVLNGITNVVMHNAALGDVSRRAQMRMFENGKAIGGGSRIVRDQPDPTAGRDADVGQVEMVTIDEAVPNSADIGIIQLDTEGYESFALLGGMATIRRCRPIVVLETVPKDVIQTQLLPLGYRPGGKVCDNSIFLP